MFAEKTEVCRSYKNTNISNYNNDTCMYQWHVILCQHIIESTIY